MFEEAQLNVGSKTYRIYPLSSIPGTEKLPYSLRVLLENVVRNVADEVQAQLYVDRIIEAAKSGQVGQEIEFSPARVLFQDFTGVPVFVDFAAMRKACVELGGDPSMINPLVPCDLVIDHSVIADEAGCAHARETNERLEFERNKERYEFLKWAQESFDNVRIVAPGQGICHQLNIEQLASVVMAYPQEEQTFDLAYFDSVVGTDSHTPTVNGIGVLGWGVGGIEAEAAALGQPITTLVPRVVGINLTGKLGPDVSAMDVALTFAQMLRKVDVVGAFVECFGPGLAELSATQRACISNMTPEYGCTCTLFPLDERTIEYLRLTGRNEEHIQLIEAYAKVQGFWASDQERSYAQVIDFDLSDVKRCIAGPSRPHQTIALSHAKEAFERVCAERGVNPSQQVSIDISGETVTLGQGAIAIAAVTSCTTATDPAMMLTCGLLAQKAAQVGLRARPWVKTIFAPGSHAVEMLLERAGLMEGLRQIGFYNCGFGCMSCIGNSGPLLPELHNICDQLELASVLSGNRNFEGRISPDVSQNYLMAPALVVAYSLVGSIDFDMLSEPLGFDAQGNEVFLSDIWPSNDEVEGLLREYATTDLYCEGNKDIFTGNSAWQSLFQKKSDMFTWDPDSTYVREAPYFKGMLRQALPPKDVKDARILALLGDFITTDHISPAGSFAPDTPAGRYLLEHDVDQRDFNTYGSRRGNHEVLMRGTFGNVKLKNELAEGLSGGFTKNHLTGQIETIFETAQAYQEAHIPSVIIAGKMYGSGSSRDWAAKGPLLLGVEVVIAESFERIHRSNLIGMGILPLQFKEGENARSLGLKGDELITVEHICLDQGMPQPHDARVRAVSPDGGVIEFTVTVRVDTPTEGAYLMNGGILHYVLRSLL